MAKTKQQPGFVALISVIIVGLISLSIVLTLVAVNINTGKNSLDIKNGEQARLLAEACAEQALLKIALDRDYVGSDELVFPTGSCFYTVFSGAGESRRIEVKGNYQKSIRREVVLVSAVKPVITIFSWQDVADF